MNLEGTEDSASRFAAYIEELTSVIGHADRARPMNDYCAGLLVTEGRRSVEPIAGVTAPDKTSVQHQKLLHFVAEAPWSDEPVLVKVREMVVPAIERHGPIAAWIIDDTSFPKCGSKSVGVHHQYCGQLGKQANCQVAVTLSIANHHASLPIAYRLYLPEEWEKDAARRKKARVPKAITFKTKPEIALEQIRKAYAAGVPREVLARHCRKEHFIPRSGRSRKNAVAGRARLPGAQARSRPRALRGPRVAGLPSSRHTLHRSLRVPDLRTGDDSPLRTSLRWETQKTCHSR